MKYLFAALSFVLGLSAAVQAADPVRVAVLTFESEDLSKTVMQVLTERFSAELAKGEGLKVEERTVSDELYKEMNFRYTDMYKKESGKETVAQKTFEGVNKLIVGRIGKLGTVFLINIRMVDVNTGKIDLTLSENCKCAEEELPDAIIKVAQKLAVEAVKVKK
jgi:TolB-like protein